MNSMANNSFRRSSIQIVGTKYNTNTIYIINVNKKAAYLEPDLYFGSFPFLCL